MQMGAAILLLVLSAAPAVAQETHPTTHPPTQAAAPGNPRETLRLLNVALRDGNAAGVRQLFQTRGEQEAKLVSAMADYAAALAALHKEAIKAYGKTGANAVTGDTDAESAEGLEAIDKAEVTIDGDAATVKYTAGGDAPVHLARVEGSWKLPLSQLVTGADRAAEQHRLEELLSQRRMAQQTADEIARGKFKSAEDAAHAWQGRLLDVVLASATQKRGE